MSLHCLTACATLLLEADYPQNPAIVSKGLDGLPLLAARSRNMSRYESAPSKHELKLAVGSPKRRFGRGG
jgi:hypothetical protein